MQGAGKNPGRWSVELDEAGVRLRGDEPPGAEGAALAGVLAAERSETWTGVTLPPNTRLDLPNLWLATVLGLCWVYANRGAVDRGVALGNWTVNAPALADGGSLAIRGTARPVDDEGTAYEFGVYGYGPRGAELAGRLAEQYRVWDRDHRHGPGPVLTIHPATTPASELPAGHVFHKPHTTMVLSWPEAATT
jgi:protein-L-isoaspartate(D-aspartate) O-methyltransferase